MSFELIETRWSSDIIEAADLPGAPGPALVGLSRWESSSEEKTLARPSAFDPSRYPTSDPTRRQRHSTVRASIWQHQWMRPQTQL